MNVPITYTPTHPVDLVTDGETSAAGITPYRGTSLSKLRNEMGPDELHHDVHDRHDGHAVLRRGQRPRAPGEPVKKGKTFTVKGTLTRADWETTRYSGYTGQPVALQSKAKGALTTTVKAATDGSYRYKFAGTSTTATGDHVDVK
ncbi:hypothetical protein [Streptomyces mirabilis]